MNDLSLDKGRFALKFASWAMTIVVFNTQRSPVAAFAISYLTRFHLVIMEFRLYALWERSRIILAILAVGFTSEIILVWTTTAIIMNTMKGLSLRSISSCRAC
jgi:hypothetical protein